MKPLAIVLGVALAGCTGSEPARRAGASGGASATGGGGAAGGVAGSGGASDGGSPDVGDGGAGGAGGTSGMGGAGGSGDAGGAAGAGDGGVCPGVPRPRCAGNPPFVNPLVGDTGIHDPSIVAEACTFYAFATGGVLPGKTSTDLVTWTRYNPPRLTMPAWLGTGFQIWASDAHRANGKFWVYYSIWHGSVSTAQIGLMTNATLDYNAPGYAWVDGGLVVDNASGGGSGVNVIDPDLFIDDDGSWWLIYGSFNNGVRLLSLDPATGLPKTRPVSPTTITDHLGEGASLIKNHGYYYVFVSRGGCCAGTASTYEIIYARSNKVTGPYTTKSGRAFLTSSYQDSTDALLRVGSDGNTGGEGGQSLFEVNGQWYIDYHAYVQGANPAKLVVRPIYFDSADWATFDCTQAAN